MDVHYIDWNRTIHNSRENTNRISNQRPNITCPICGSMRIRIFKLIGFKCEENVFKCMNNDCKYTW